MTNRQVSWVLFLVSIMISFLFLGTMVNMNYELDNQKRRTDSLDKEIKI